MGKFKDKISKLSNSEMEEIWKDITSYQESYIDDFLIELNFRGIRDDFFLNDYTLKVLFSKVSYPENIDYLKSLIEKRGLTISISNTEKKKVNYTIPTVGIAMLIVVIIKLIAINIGNEIKVQVQGPPPEIPGPPPRIDTVKIYEDISKKLFEPGGLLRVKLDLINVEIQEMKKAGKFNKAKSEEFIKKLSTEMKEKFFTNSNELPQEVKDKISAQYLSELRQIIK